jgi:thiamine biosynthesis protein ThiS
MEVYVNEKPYQVQEDTLLSALMEEIGVKPQGVAIAVGYEVIPREKWTEFRLTDKMELTLIRAVSGG